MKVRNAVEDSDRDTAVEDSDRDTAGSVLLSEDCSGGITFVAEDTVVVDWNSATSIFARMVVKNVSVASIASESSTLTLESTGSLASDVNTMGMELEDTMEVDKSELLVVCMEADEVSSFVTPVSGVSVTSSIIVSFLIFVSFSSPRVELETGEDMDGTSVGTAEGNSEILVLLAGESEVKIEDTVVLSDMVDEIDRLLVLSMQSVANVTILARGALAAVFESLLL